MAGRRDDGPFVKIPFFAEEWLKDYTDEEIGQAFRSTLLYYIDPEDASWLKLTGKAFELFLKLRYIVDYQKKHPHWNGGRPEDPRIVRNSLEYRKWRNAVFVRDDYTCQKCGIRGGELNAHHIKPFSKYPELRLSVDNGITLCESCHKEVHRNHAKPNP